MAFKKAKPTQAEKEQKKANSNKKKSRLFNVPDMGVGFSK